MLVPKCRDNNRVFAREMSTNSIKKALKDFGLTEKEAEIYIFLAKHGVQTGGEISKLTKTHRPHMYRILRSLLKKGAIQSTLESPVRFSSVPFEKILDESIRIKHEEAALLEKTKNGLLIDWKNISSPRIEFDLAKFVVIEGNSNIYSKISEMIEETKHQLSLISTVEGLARAEQFGVFDSAYSHPLKSTIKFRFLTELSRQNLKAMKLLMPKLKSELNIRGITPDLSLALTPRMVIRDDEEILFFISPKADMFSTGQDETCLLTNCKSLIQTLAGTFEGLWKNSTYIEDKIFEVETGKILPQTLLVENAEAIVNYDVALNKVKEQLRSQPRLTAQLTRIEHSLPEMVGREEELRRLKGFLQQAQRGNGNTILISGEAGIGKTRLVAELELHALSFDIRVLKSSCIQESGMLLSPFRKILMDLFNVSDEELPENRRKKISSQIKEICPKLTLKIPLVDNIITSPSIATKTYTKGIRGIGPNDLESLFQRDEENAILSQLFASFSEKQPIMLFIDDLHLADSSSLRFFQRLAKITQESNLFLVGTYRQESLVPTAEEINPPLLDTLRSMDRDSLFHKIELKRLSSKDCLDLVDRILGIDNDEFGKLIYGETEGNPFFVLETLRFLINKKILTRKGDTWSLAKEIAKIELPPGVHNVISRRINILKDEERDVLDCASILGQEFSSDMIEKITGLSRLPLLKKLNNIERKYQLIHSFDGKYRFDHAKIREVLYQEMSPELRKEYHSSIAGKLEEMFKENLEEVVNELAYHYYMSENAEKAVPYLIEAGEKSKKEWALFETIRDFSQALELMKDDAKWSKERTETLEALGSLYGLAAEHDLANEHYRKGINSTDDEAAKDRMKRKIRRKKFVENNRVKLAYYVYGKGEPTLFLLAWSSTAEMWIPQVTYFSQKYKVITMDMRGTGESDKPRGEYTVDVHASDLKAIIDDLQDNNIIFVGAWGGGKIAVKYVTSYPGKISKLALLTFFAGPNSAFPGFDSKVFEEEHERALKSPSWRVKKYWENIFPGPVGESFREWGLKSAQKTPPEIFVNSLYNYFNTDVRPLLGKIDIPTLILNGDKAPFALKKVKYLQEKIPGSKIFIFRGMGPCFINMLAANKFNRILETFINSGEIKN